jgi:Transcriptional regulator, AbiEi antitoxin/Protein of unknown function (DUF559)
MDQRKPDRATLDKHAADQHGLFTRAQAAACGYSEYQIRRRRNSGEWITVLGPVLADRGVQVTPLIRDIAVQLALPGSVLAGPSAARWHRMDIDSAETFVVVSRDRQVRLAGVHAFRESLPADDVCRVGEAFVTNPERTVFDCVRVLPDVAALALLDQALRQGWTSVPGFGDRLRAFTSRRGAPRMVKLLRTAALGARSAAERLASRLLQRAGIWGWLANEPISDRWGVVCVGDIVFPRAMLLIELDGRSSPVETARLNGNRERQNRLAAAGWTVLRFTWFDLTTRPDYVVATIRAMLDRLGAGSR